ncbi:hypothetical protein [Alicyclobacillus mengziensis]|uniref:Uncharacterized protein n=1 Tax=Alicyclobacillus mengziensis TaxID=2931921 RepID=A0A9X7W2P9_9BACL|nr:hypothetical protein [Alicyclobacillus mengziensis]QSO49417.1 hypothetical protein JZ786_11120 [Alicyclobacillus mengziensis]
MRPHSDAIQVLVAIAAFVIIAMALAKVVHGVLGMARRRRETLQGRTRD